MTKNVSGRSLYQKICADMAHSGAHSLLSLAAGGRGGTDRAGSPLAKRCGILLPDRTSLGRLSDLVFMKALCLDGYNLIYVSCGSIGEDTRLVRGQVL